MSETDEHRRYSNRDQRLSSAPTRHKEGRHDDAAEIERRIDGYREELGRRP